jgi:ABC-type oligopeptide transport system substrate-binding subunit
MVIGPYKVNKWRRDQSLLLEPNLQSAQAREPDSIEFVFIPEDATALALFEKKELDVVFHVPQIMRKTYRDQLLVMPQLTNYFFAFGLEGKSAQSESFRLALRKALPTAEIPQWLGQEVRPLERRFLPLKLQARSAKFYNANSRKKERIIAQDLKLYIYNKSSHKQLAEWAQEKWQKKLGIKVPIEVREEKVYWSELPKKSAPMFLNGITAPYPHPRAFLQDFLSDSSANWTGFRSKKFDLLVAQGKFVDAEKVLLDSGWVIPLYERGQVILANAKWRGKIWVNPLGRLLLGQSLRARASSAF